LKEHLELEEGQASLPYCPDAGCCFDSLLWVQSVNSPN